MSISNSSKFISKLIIPYFHFFIQQIYIHSKNIRQNIFNAIIDVISDFVSLPAMSLFYATVKVAIKAFNSQNKYIQSVQLKWLK